MRKVVKRNTRVGLIHDGCLLLWACHVHRSALDGGAEKDCCHQPNHLRHNGGLLQGRKWALLLAQSDQLLVQRLQPVQTTIR